MTSSIWKSVRDIFHSGQVCLKRKRWNYSSCPEMEKYGRIKNVEYEMEQEFGRILKKEEVTALTALSEKYGIKTCRVREAIALISYENGNAVINDGKRIKYTIYTYWVLCILVFLYNLWTVYGVWNAVLTQFHAAGICCLVIGEFMLTLLCMYIFLCGMKDVFAASYINKVITEKK